MSANIDLSGLREAESSTAGGAPTSEYVGPTGATTVGQAPTSVYVGPTQTSDAVQGENSTYNAVNREVGENELASNRLNMITRQDSPLMARARAEAARVSNSRGLQNSSIAAGAAMGAMVDRATPLAQQEAQTYSNQALTNQQFENRAGEVNAATGAQFELTNTEAANRAALLDTEVGQQNEQFNTQNQTQVALADGS